MLRLLYISTYILCACDNDEERNSVRESCIKNTNFWRATTFGVWSYSREIKTICELKCFNVSLASRLLLPTSYLCMFSLLIWIVAERENKNLVFC